MRKSLFSFAALAVLGIAAGACGELTGPVSPTTPIDVVATLMSATSVRVTWTPSPLNDGVTSYSVFRNGTIVGESDGTATTYTDTGLSPQVTYVYSVAANCVGGVTSDRSVETAASTVLTRDVTPPRIVQTIPVAGATQVSSVANVNAIFNEAMDPATINATTFTVRISNGAAIAGTVTYNPANLRATFTPTSSLPNFTSVTATVTTGVKDVSGNALARDTTWTFLTRDDLPPTVIATSPANGATGVPPTTQVTLTFSEPMDPASINAANITLRATAGGIVTSVVTYNAATRVATLTPSATLAQSTNYTVNVSPAVRDVQGNAIGAFSFSFTTGDTTSPTVISTVPADGATGVAQSSTISATFSEAMDQATINTITFTVRPTSSSTNLAGTVGYNAATNTATFTPAALASSTSYTATITTGARDASGNPLAAAKVWTFVTADNTPPTVLSRTPVNGATGVATNTNATVTFSEVMDPATINASNITLTPSGGGAAVAATVTCNSPCTTATLNPTADLANSVSYTLTVTTGVRDVAGNALASQSTSTFTTAAAADNTPPTVLSRTPVNGATGVAVSTNATVTFSEPMDPATINTSTVTLTLTSGGSPVAATVTCNSPCTTATLNPAADLANSTNYTLTVTTGARDVAGNALAAPSTSTFTTAAAPDVTPPTVVSRTPANAATGVAVNTNATVTFSEAMDPATISTTTITLALTSGGAPVAATVTCNTPCTTATLNPTVNLTNGGVSYTLTVTTGVEDVAGNPLAAQSTSTFTTVDTTSPTVIATSPLNGATAVPITTTVTVTFSENMDATTINGTTFTLATTIGTVAVAGTVSYNPATRVATFTPTAPLLPSIGYTATVNTGAEDVAGNPLIANFNFSFTTAP